MGLQICTMYLIGWLYKGTGVPFKENWNHWDNGTYSLSPGRYCFWSHMSDMIVSLGTQVPKMTKVTLSSQWGSAMVQQLKLRLLLANFLTMSIMRQQHTCLRRAEASEDVDVLSLRPALERRSSISMAWARLKGFPFAGLAGDMDALGPCCCISMAQALVIDLFFASLIRPAGVPLDWELPRLSTGRVLGCTLSVVLLGTMPGQRGEG